MSKIITITLNPCIDKSTAVPSLIADTKLRCGETKSEPRGGGINVSRARQKLGGNSTAWFLAGGYSGDFSIELMKQKEIMYHPFKIKNETRDSLILLDKSNSNQYLFDFERPFVEEKEWRLFLEAIKNFNAADNIVSVHTVSCLNFRGF